MIKSCSESIGIDLGTTFSAVAIVDDAGEAVVLSDANSRRLVPSVLFFEENGGVIVGQVAKQYAVSQADRIVEFVKREMGRTSKEFSRTFDGVTYDAEQLSGLLLAKLKQHAEAALGREVSRAVITVPAYFGDQQRAATKRAASLVGLEVDRLLNEPVAAAISAGVQNSIPDGRFMVFDLGGGTLDISIIEKTGTHLTVIATDGDHRLGGKDWDNNLITHAAERFEERFQSSPLNDLNAYQDLQLRVIQAKEALTERSSVPLVVQYEGNTLTLNISRDQFESLSSTLLARCKFLCESALEKASMSWDQISLVLLVGGSTRMPMISKMLKEKSGRSVISVSNPDEAVALGAALVAGGSGGALLSEDATGLIQVKDCTVHSLGVIVKESRSPNAPDVLSIVIPHGSKIGQNFQQTYFTLHDNQTSVNFRVMEGESLGTAALLGECLLTDVPPSAAGRPLKFELRYDDNHMLTATGTDIECKRACTVRIKRPLDQSPLELAASRAAVAALTVQ